MNSVTLIGRLTKDVDVSYIPNNTAVGKFTIAVDRPKRNGEDAGADFIRIVAWGKTAETCGQYLSKGREVAIIGRIQTGSYKKDGQTIYTTDVVADRVEFIGSKNDKKVEKVKEDVMELFGDDVGFQYTTDGIPF